MKSTFCALNIFDCNFSLVNTDGRPIMFIWNGIDDLKTSLSSEEFYTYLNEKNYFSNVENYAKGVIKSFTYLNENDEELYNDVDLIIQNIFPLNEYKSILEKYLSDLMFILWHKVFKKDFIETLDMTPTEEILYMYDSIIEKYGDRVSIDTIIQAIRSEIQTNEKYKELNSLNQESLLEYLKTIINGREK